MAASRLGRRLHVCTARPCRTRLENEPDGAIMTNTDSASGSPHSPHNSHAAPSLSAAPPVAPEPEPTPAVVAHHKAGDQPFFDPVAYGNGPDDSVTDSSENAAVTKHSIVIGGRKIAYTATAGHLVTVDPSSSVPNAKMFYVAFTQDNQKEDTRPVTFFYNGGPGSSSVFVLLGSFAPRRIKTAMPSFTPPAPYSMEDNPDSMIDKSDLVFINPVGTGYSAAIAPSKNRDFWGVDQDASSIKQFIKRFLTKNNRWNSPKYLYGESYGTARSCVLAYMLHEDGVDLNGITLQSSILDYTQSGNPVGALPTAAADAWYHKKLGVAPTPKDLGAFAEEVAQFARTDYLAALRKAPATDAATVEKLSEYTGIDKPTLLAWNLDIAGYDSRGDSLFLTTLLKSKGLALGEYDGRVTAIETGIAGKINPNSGGNDPTMTAVTGVYTAMWNVYLNEQLLYTSNSAFTDLNDQAFQYWDFSHIDPTGAQKGLDSKGNVILYTAGDLAAVMALNTDLKVLSANGFYDFVTPFYQTVIDLQKMPLVSAEVRQNLSARFYPSGHMVYLDGASRTALKADVAKMYDTTVSDTAAVSRIRALQARKQNKA
jgi:carboxypeptidase C (cathepsin A)